MTRGSFLWPCLRSCLHLGLGGTIDDLRSCLHLGLGGTIDDLHVTEVVGFTAILRGRAPPPNTAKRIRQGSLLLLHERAIHSRVTGVATRLPIRLHGVTDVKLAIRTILLTGSTTSIVVELLADLLAIELVASTNFPVGISLALVIPRTACA